MKNDVANISLSELAVMENLSVRAQNFCRKYNLEDLNSILNYYHEFKNFLNLDNCGIKSNLELLNVCARHEKIIFQPKNEIIEVSHFNPDDESIYALTRQKSFIIKMIESSTKMLSVRILNALKGYLGSDINIEGLKLILSLPKSDFENIPNIGAKSAGSIRIFLNSVEKHIQMLSNIESQIAGHKLRNQSNPILDKINSLNTRKVNVINSLIEEKINYLSVYSKIALVLFLDNDLTLKSLETLIFSDPEFKIEFIPGIDNISKKEIKSFLLNIKEQVEFVSELHDSVVEFELSKIFIRKRFSLENNVITDFFMDYNIANGLPIFKVIRIFTDNGKLIKGHSKIIFQNSYCISNSDLSRRTPLIIPGITRERVRQLKVILLQRFNKIFNFITQPEIKSFINYGFDLSGNYLEITDDLISNINKLEGTIFNRLFITKIIALLFSDKYDLIGKVDHNKAFKTNSSGNWKGCYIVDKQLISVFDFDRFIDDVKNKVAIIIKEDFSLPFRSYLLKFSRIGESEVSDMIAETAKYILFCEFDLNIDPNENLIFSRNTFKRVNSYSYEALEKLGKPSRVCDIYLKVKELYPDYTGSQNKIKVSLKRKYGFVPIGRSSVFGLKKWELTIKNFKGGTIREIAEEYLQCWAEPKHINEITEYVCRYRTTNAESIYINLHLDKSEKFVFFSGTFIGLCNKKYSDEKYVKIEKQYIERKSWEERFIGLQNFADENHRLPCSKGSESETLLFRFLKIQLNKARKRELDISRINRLSELISKFNYKSRKRRSTILLESDLPGIHIV